ncbi:MAG: hypothetical protein WCG29_09195 [Desulfomonile sp.]|jgi:hypothetical protein|nr:hypothetical protein [Deltaproteobacteria bacterium]
MKLLVTIDVEEEGLFRGIYERTDVQVSNVPALYKLDSIFREWGIHPTLLLTYQVVGFAPYGDLMADLKERWGAEIGAHLHHWNTPPLIDLPHRDPVPSELIPVEILQSKMNTLLEAFDAVGVSPVSFRMGRFNMGTRMFSVLEKTPILVDSSVAPLRREYGGPDHFAAQIDPYFPDPADIVRPGSSSILEAPITIVPLTPALGHYLEQLRTRAIFPDSMVSWVAPNLCSIPVQPVWTGLKRLKIAVDLHRRRGGQVLTIFFHSSELMPGISPQHPSPAHVDRFLQKLSRFFAWLHKSNSVESLTLSQLRSAYAG